MKKLVILFVSLFCFLTANSQNQSPWDVGVFVGKTNYLGDLVDPSLTFAHGEFSGGAFLRYHLRENINLRSNLLVGTLSGDDANYSSHPERGADFTSNLLELTLLGEYDLYDIVVSGEGDLKERLTPYGFLGLGFSLINPEVNFTGNSPEISADKTAQYSDLQVVLPIGVGVKYNVMKNLTVGAELGAHFAFTDYLDGVSESGDTGNKDKYLSWRITAAYRLGNTDADNDGIADKKDLCPNKPGPAKFNGCPDTDGDGLVDSEDDCPNDPGKALLKGCPDADNDGVSDFVDDCPDDPGIRRLGGCPDKDNDGIVDPEDNCPDEAGIASMNGCPDADRDGLTDSKDECPLEPGTLMLNGCPDSDQDGVVDKNDRCPDVKGSARNFGCPDRDTDGDGLIDRKDRCPDQAGPEDNAGCPEIKQEDQAVLDFAMTNVEFETGSDSLTASSLEVLDLIVGIMTKYKGYQLTINGHTDNVGEAEKNLQLSKDRAKSCFDYLVSKGINPLNLTYTGFGETQPIDDNETEEGRMQNRRVEFILAADEVRE